MKLVSAEKIVRIDPIEGADQIEKATVLGWEIVVKKGEYKSGDLSAYIQIDTVVPETDQFEFLRPRGFRVRTIKLRKQISQGLLVPLPPGDFNEGDDLTDIIGVKKFQKEVEQKDERPKKPKMWYKKWWWIIKYRFLVKIFPALKTVNRAGFPTGLVPITDEERIQNIPSVLEKYKGKLFVVSEKLDGSSITLIYDGKKVRVCSRRFELFNTQNEWHRVYKETEFEKHLKVLAEFLDTKNIIVQGEFIGKPQGNRYNLQSDEIRLFNIYANGKRINQDLFYTVCNRSIGWNQVIGPHARINLERGRRTITTS